jgi:hypothetical protein
MNTSSSNKFEVSLKSLVSTTYNPFKWKKSKIKQNKTKIDAKSGCVQNLAVPMLTLIVSDWLVRSGHMYMTNLREFS